MDGPRCGAKVRRTGLPCKKRPVRGAKRCASHGAGAPQVKAKAAQNVVEDETRRALARLDVAPVADPLTELSKLAGQVVAWKDALAALVNRLTELRFEDHKGSEQLRSEVALFERGMDRCNTVLSTMARLRIDERLAQISEAQAERVLRAIDAALDAAGVPPAERAPAKQAAARHLRVV